MAKFEIFLDRLEQYRWRFKAANGEIVAVSEGYVRKQSAIDAVLLIQKLAPTAQAFDLTR